MVDSGTQTISTVWLPHLYHRASKIARLVSIKPLKKEKEQAACGSILCTMNSLLHITSVTACWLELNHMINPPPPSQRESGKHHEASIQEVERTGFVIIELSFALFWYISSSTGTLNLSLRVRDDRKWQNLHIRCFRFCFCFLIHWK